MTETKDKVSIILASQSPRRVALLRAVGLDFNAAPSDIDECYDVTDPPAQTVMSLAYEKGYALASKYPDAIVLSFDTVVHLDTILGKPTDATDALEMLKALNGKTHKVYTGMSIIKLDENIKVLDCVSTEVTFVSATEQMLQRYVDTGEPLDKAGAYGIQDFGALLVERIDGDYYAVMGLPLSKLNEYMMKYFDIQML